MNTVPTRPFATAITFALGIALLPVAARAATLTWSCTNSYWDIGTCWSPTGMVPVAIDDVIAGPVGSTATNLRFDNVTGTRFANSLLVNSGTAYTIGFVQTGGSLTIAADEIVGSTGTGSYTLSGGTNHVVGNLVVGETSGSNGSFIVSGAGFLSVAGNEAIGASGTGSFAQSSGTHTVTGTLVVSANSGGSGSYTLSGGNLTTGSVMIGPAATGSITQTGGTHTVNGDLALVDLSPQLNLNGRGTYTLAGGVLNVGGNIGSNYYGFFYLDGGTLNVAGSSIDIGYFYVGRNSGSNGSYTLGAGKTLTAGVEAIGDFGTGAIAQNGGTHSVSSSLHLGFNSTGRGSYILNGGTLTAGTVNVGYGGVGSITQTGGTHSVYSNLTLGVNAGSSGTYTLSGGVLNVGGNIVNGAGTSTFLFDGGTLNVTGASLGFDSFAMGSAAGSNAAFTLATGKTLTTGAVTIGGSGTGSFTHSGGTHTIGNDLSMGLVAGSSGTYTLSGGVLNVGGNIVNGAGTSNLRINGGTLNVNGTAIDVDNFGLAMIAGSNTSFTLAAGKTLATSSAGIGNTGTGSFTLSGGTHTTAGMALGVSAGSYGSYALSSGDLVTAGVEFIGSAGTGSFTQSSGTHSVGTAMYLGATSTGHGSYALTGGSLAVGNLYVGASGTGSFTQSGGTHSVSSGMTIGGTAPASSGSYTLSGGSLTAAGMIINGRAGGGTGTVNLAGGTLTADSLYNSPTGTVNYTGGTLNAGVRNENAFHLSGAGVRVIQGDVVNTGTITVTNTVAAFNGTYTESGRLETDPATLLFGDVVINETGYWVSNLGDTLFVGGDFENHSLQDALWNTTAASLVLNGSGTQNLYLAGSDLGALFSGYTNNFAWGDFTLGSGVSIHIWDGNADPDAALYVGVFELGGGLDQLAGIVSDFNIYYDPRLAGNAYLDGQTYALNGEGFLTPATVPVPPAVWLFGSGLLGLVAVARRMKRSGT